MSTRPEKRTGRESVCLQKHVYPHSSTGSRSTKWPQYAHRHLCIARNGERLTHSVLFYKRIITLRQCRHRAVNFNLGRDECLLLASYTQTKASPPPFWFNLLPLLMLIKLSRMKHSSSSLAAIPKIFFREGYLWSKWPVNAFEIICWDKACLLFCSYDAER